MTSTFESELIKIQHEIKKLIYFHTVLKLQEDENNPIVSIFLSTYDSSLKPKLNS